MSVDRLLSPEYTNNRYPFRVVKYSDDETGLLKLEYPTANSELLLEMSRKKTELRDRISDLEARKAKLSYRRSGGRRRSRREFSEAQGSLAGEINRVQRKVDILQGKALGRLDVLSEEGTIAGFEINEFSPLEGEWWNYVGGSTDLTSMYQEDQDSFRLIEQAFSIRYEIQLGNRHSSVWKKFLDQQIGDDERFDSYFRAIVQRFPN